jgi:Xaa-Pro aminopeptidase
MISEPSAARFQGEPERESAGFIEYQMKRAGADGLSIPAGVATGPNTENPVSPLSTGRLESGDIVTIGVGATWEGYSHARRDLVAV